MAIHAQQDGVHEIAVRSYSERQQCRTNQEQSSSDARRAGDVSAMIIVYDIALGNDNLFRYMLRFPSSGTRRSKLLYQCW